MRLYASNSRISRSARRRAQANRPSGIVDFSTVRSTPQRRPAVNADATQWQRLRRAMLAPNFN